MFEFTRGTIILSALAIATASQAPAQRSTNHVAVPAGLTVSEVHSRLWVRFNDLWTNVRVSGAAAEQRRTLVRFIKRDVLQQLDREAATIYPVFDSVSAGGFATKAARFDGQMINRLANELEADVNSRERTLFGERGYALAIALESYFTKTDQLVWPVIQAQLSPLAMQTLVARIESFDN